jgi:hypothetical protein
MVSSLCHQQGLRSEYDGHRSNVECAALHAALHIQSTQEVDLSFKATSRCLIGKEMTAILGLGVPHEAEIAHAQRT